MSRFSWYEVTVEAPTGNAMTFTEYAENEREAVSCFRSRGARSKKAKVIRVALEAPANS